jgi:signal transduction histidine kinase
MRVLVIDPSPSTRSRFTERIAILPGVAQVEIAIDVIDATQLLYSAVPDVVLLDAAPRNLIIGLLGRLRSANTEVTNIVLTNAPTRQSRSACLQAGADFYFDKSSEFQRAIDVIAGLAFRRSRSRGTNGAVPPESVTLDRLAQTWEGQRLETIGRLAGGLTNDFNNLLTVIIGHGREAMDRLDADDPSRTEVKQILRAGTQAAALTRQFLDFARRQFLAPKILDMNAVIEPLLSMLKRVIGEGIDLVPVIGSEALVIKGDPAQLEQVIVNLVVNARDAMPHGGTVTISVEPASMGAAETVEHPWIPPGEYVRLEVRDTGIGTEPDIRAHVFDPLLTTTSHDAATGLGLSTVYGIVKQSGGYILADSEPGGGAIFSLYFPRHATSAIN